MKGILSASTIGIMVTTIILGLVILDYKVLRKNTGLKSSSLVSLDDKQKVYDVDTMAVVLDKIETLSAKVERLNGIIEKLMKTKGLGNKERHEVVSQGLFRRKNVPFKYDFFNNPNATERRPFEFKSFDTKKPKAPDSFRDLNTNKKPKSISNDPLKELFSLTKLFKDYDKERAERKNRERKEEKRLIDSPAKANGVNSKDDVLKAVKKEFKNATDLVPTKKEEPKEDDSKISDSHLFFHPTSSIINSQPFDNLANLTDFSGSISSTIIRSKEVPDDKSGQKKKITSQINVNIERKPSSSESNLGKDLYDHRSDANTILKNASLDDSKEPTKEAAREPSKSKDIMPDKPSTEERERRDPEKSQRLDGFTSDKGSKFPKSLTRGKTDDAHSKPTTDSLSDATQEHLQSEKDRQVEQAHLQKEKENKENPLLKDFAQVEKEFIEKHRKPVVLLRRNTIITTTPALTASTKEGENEDNNKAGNDEKPSVRPINVQNVTTQRPKPDTSEPSSSLDGKTTETDHQKIDTRKKDKGLGNLTNSIDLLTSPIQQSAELKATDASPTNNLQGLGDTNVLGNALTQDKKEIETKNVQVENHNDKMDETSSSSDTHEFAPTAENSRQLIGSKIQV